MSGPGIHSRTHLPGGTDPITLPPDVDSIDGGGGQLTGDVTLSAGTGITLNQVGQDIEIVASATSPTGRTPRFLCASRTDDVAASTAWAPTDVWTITKTNDDGTFPSTSSPTGDWRGTTFSVSGNGLFLNSDAPPGLMLAYGQASIGAWSASAPATLAFGVGPKPGAGLGSFTISGIYPYVDVGSGVLMATGPQVPTLTTTLGIGPLAYAMSRWGSLKYSTLGADADITPTAFQDSAVTATVTIQMVYVHLADWGDVP